MGIPVLLHARPGLSEEILSFEQITAAAATQTLGIVDFAGVINQARVAAITPLTGNATYTADIKKNGTTILTAPMALASGTAARASVIGTLATPPISVQPGDFFETVVAKATNTGTDPANIAIQVSILCELAGAQRIPLGIAPSSGVVYDARIANLTPLTGNDTYLVDFQKNGASILVGGTPISLTSTSAARQSISGAVSTTAVTAGDYFEAVITPTHGTGTLPQGVMYQVALLLNN